MQAEIDAVTKRFYQRNRVCKIGCLGTNGLIQTVFNSHEKGAIEAPCKSQLRSAYRHRKAAKEKLSYSHCIKDINKVKSVDDLEEALSNDEESMTYKWDSQIHRIISAPLTSYDDKEYKHIFWCDKQFLNELDVKQLFIDATFRVISKMYMSRTKSQFLTIIAETSSGSVSTCNNT